MIASAAAWTSRPKDRFLWLVAVTGIAFGLIGEAIWLQAGQPASAALLNLAIGWTYLFGGLAAWSRRPANGTGRLMALVGLLWFLGNLSMLSVEVVRLTGVALADSAGIALIALVLAYPTGRLEGRFERLTVTALAIGLTATNTLQVVVDLGDTGVVIGLGLAVLAAVAVIRRWLIAAPSHRRELVPVLIAGNVLMGTIVVTLAVRLLDVPQGLADVLLAAKELAPAAVPIAILIGFFLAEREARLADLQASRARIVEASDAERRRVERNLHDGAQQRLVALSLALRRAQSQLPADAGPELTSTLEGASEQLKTALAELRELAKGIHPAILTEAGLGPALRSLAKESPVPVTLRLELPERPAVAVAAAAYFVAAEALANVAKYADAGRVELVAETERGDLRIEIADDGRGGADPAAGSGLRGLADRVAALGGRLDVRSPVGGGTRVVATLPLAAGVEVEA